MHHVDSTLKQRGNGLLHVVSTWNPGGLFVGYEVIFFRKVVCQSSTGVSETCLSYQGKWKRYKERKKGSVDKVLVTEKKSIGYL